MALKLQADGHFYNITSPRRMYMGKKEWSWIKSNTSIGPWHGAETKTGSFSAGTYVAGWAADFRLDDTVIIKINDPLAGYPDSSNTKTYTKGGISFTANFEYHWDSHTFSYSVRSNGSYYGYITICSLGWCFKTSYPIDVDLDEKVDINGHIYAEEV